MPGRAEIAVARAELLAFMRSAPWWVEATVAPGGAPQAAVIGAAVADDFSIVFDTLDTTRKLRNLRRDPRVALVTWVGERTVQLEGLADEPKGEALARLKALYLARFPDGRAREGWTGIAYVRVRPTWVRLSDFGASDRPLVFEWGGAELAPL